MRIPLQSPKRFHLLAKTLPRKYGQYFDVCQILGFSYKTFVPNATKVGMCTGSPEYESLDETWDRARAWLRLVGKNPHLCAHSNLWSPLAHYTSAHIHVRMVSCSDRRVVSIETFYHTLNKIWHEQDLGETTVMNGEWSQRDRREVPRKSRLQLVQVIRLVFINDASNLRE